MWADYVGAGLLTLGVIGCLKLFGVVGRARAVVDVSRETFRKLSDASLSEEDKERAAQSSSGRLFGEFLFITLGSAAALAAPTLGLWAFDAAGVLSLAGAVRAASSWPFIMGAIVVAIAAMWLGRASL
jgi:hypothetical protein